MFDVGFSELLVIGIVALIVIGPEKLPAVARTVGHLLGRAQRYVSDVKSDINREMQLEELKKLQSQLQTDITDSARNFEQSIKQGVQEAQAAVHEAQTTALEALPEMSLLTSPDPQNPPVVAKDSVSLSTPSVTSST